jgi:hypothetical protein
MTPAHVTNGNRRYRYYTCSAAQKKGWHTCPSKSLPAAALERFVLEQVATRAADGTVGSSSWPALAPHEQARRLRRIVARIDYDGSCNQVAIMLKPAALAGTAPWDLVEEIS